jgi:hypothetical protein
MIRETKHIWEKVTVSPEKRPVGIFRPKSQQQWQSFIKHLPDDDYEVLVRSIQKSQTAEQRGYYFGAIIQPIVDASGLGEFEHVQRKLHKEEVDAFFSKMFLTVDSLDLKTGENTERVRSKGELTRFEYSRYIDHVIHYLAEEWGFIVAFPDPEHNLTGWYKPKKGN